jgi:hypothetical protein
MTKGTPDSLNEDQLALADQTHRELGMNKSFIGTEPNLPEHRSSIGATILAEGLEQKSRKPPSIYEGSKLRKYCPLLIETPPTGWPIKQRTCSYKSPFGSYATNTMVGNAENTVPGLIAVQQDQVVEDHDSDEDDEEEDNEYVRRLFRPKLPPSIKADFSLCDTCYTTSKEFSYTHIGVSRRKNLLVAAPDGFWKSVSCCVLGAVIDYAWKKSRSITGATDAVTVPTYTSGKRVFGSKMTDILLLSDNPILPRLQTSLRVNLDYRSPREENQPPDFSPYGGMGQHGLTRGRIYRKETEKVRDYLLETV